MHLKSNKIHLLHSMSRFCVSLPGPRIKNSLTIQYSLRFIIYEFRSISKSRNILLNSWIDIWLSIVKSSLQERSFLETRLSSRFNFQYCRKCLEFFKWFSTCCLNIVDLYTFYIKVTKYYTCVFTLQLVTSLYLAYNIALTKVDTFCRWVVYQGRFCTYFQILPV